jgi:deoxyribose-phosphate aldolase
MEAFDPSICRIWQPPERDLTPRGEPGALQPLWSLVRTLRRLTRLDQRAFAAQVGLSKSALARLERGHTTSLPVATLVSLVEAAGCTIEVLEADRQPLRHSWADVGWIDRSRRRAPAHVDVRSTRLLGSWWGDEPLDWTWRARRTRWTYDRPDARRRAGTWPAYAGEVTTTASARANVLPDVTSSQATLRRFLHGLPGVDQVGAELRAASLSTRSIKTDAKSFALDLAIRMIDLTTLEGADTPGKVRALCAKAQRPDPTDPTAPAVAAVCVYGDLVGVARAALGDSGVKVAAVTTAFPSGRASFDVKLADTRDAVRAGADEVDMVIDRGAFLAGHYQQVLDEIRAIKEQCSQDGHDAHLKVILETGELQTLDNVRRASWLAMLGGADFIKTSTGKVVPAATPPVTLVMLEAVRDFRDATGHQVGVKAAGGIRTAKDAIRYLVLVNETVGDDWLDPDWFRLGASSLLNDLLMQRAKQATGRYSGPDYFTLD